VNPDQVVIKVATPGPQGPAGPQGPQGPAGAGGTDTIFIQRDFGTVSATLPDYLARVPPGFTAKILAVRFFNQTGVGPNGFDRWTVEIKDGATQLAIYDSAVDGLFLNDTHDLTVIALADRPADTRLNAVFTKFNGPPNITDARLELHIQLTAVP